MKSEEITASNCTQDFTSICPAATANKRARMISPPPPLGFADLPDEVLVNIVTYLPRTSRALLAVAVTASSSAWKHSNYTIKPSETVKVILSAVKWCTYTFIGFGDKEEKELVDKLTEEDIGGYLACADAVHGVKSFSLDYCKNLVGYGLEPLRNSSKLAKIYLSPIEGDNNELSLSEDVVIPILESIIEKRENPLYFTLPKKWCDKPCQLVVDFLQKYNKLMNTRSVGCDVYEHGRSDSGEFKRVGCFNICQGTDARPWVNPNAGDLFGMHNMTCDGCNQTYCGECATEYFHKEACVKCAIRGCKECVESFECVACKEVSCYDCTRIDTCDTCGEASCNDCCYVAWCECCEQKHCLECRDHEWCDHLGCGTSNCAECVANESEEDYCLAKYCPVCKTSFCSYHILDEHIKRGEDDFCSNCNERAASQLLQENNKFETWIHKMENKYCGGAHNSRMSATTGTFSDLLKARDMLRQRCNAIGDRLPIKQKEFEQFDNRVKEYDGLFGES